MRLQHEGRVDPRLISPHDARISPHEHRRTDSRGSDSRYHGEQQRVPHMPDSGRPGYPPQPDSSRPPVSESVEITRTQFHSDPSRLVSSSSTVSNSQQTLTSKQMIHLSVEKAMQNQQNQGSSATRMSMIIEESIRKEAERVSDINSKTTFVSYLLRLLDYYVLCLGAAKE